MFCIMLRETVKIILAVTLVGGLLGKLALILINWMVRLISIKKMVGAFLIHVLLILVLATFGFFLYWMLQPSFSLDNIIDFVNFIFLGIWTMVSGCLLIKFFKKEKGNKVGEKK